MERDTLIVLLFFLLLSIIVSWNALTTGGHFIYRDEWTMLCEGKFGVEYLTHIAKRDILTDLDSYKRIPELWIHLFVDYEAYDRIKFTLIAFFTLLSSFYVFNKILENEKIGHRKRTLISTLGAVSYLINPLNTQLFLSYYPSTNYVLFPLFIYFLYKGFVDNNLKHVLLSAVIASFMFLMVVHSALYLLVSFIAIGAVILTRRIDPIFLLRGALLFLLVCFSCTAFALLPYLHVALFHGYVSGYHGLTLDMLSMFSEVSPLPTPMIMDFHIFWWPYVDYEYPFGDTFFLLSAVFSAVLILHAFFDRSGWSLMSLVALLLLFFFAKGNGPPFSDIYEILNFQTPIVGWLMRVPMKFAHIIPFFFSLIFLRFSLSMFTKKRRAFYIVPAAYILFLCIFSWPFFTGDMNAYLVKGDYTIEKEELKAINKILEPGDFTVLPYEISYQRFNDINADFLDISFFLNREKRDYEYFDDWSALEKIASKTGIQYIITSPEYNEELGKDYEQIFDGVNYSVFRLNEDPSAVQVMSSAYLCYGGRGTARSIIRDPPPTGDVEGLIFPYLTFDFPSQYLNASDYVVLSSEPLPFTSVDSDKAFGWRSRTIGSELENEWVAISMDNAVRQREHILEPYPDFYAGFAMSGAKSFDGNGSYRPIVLSLDDLEFITMDNLTEKQGNFTFVVQSGYSPSTSLVVARLDVEKNALYRMSMSVRANSSAALNSYLLFLDADGNLLHKRQLLMRAGTFTSENTYQLLTTSNTSSVMLLFSSDIPKNDSYTYTIESLELREIFYDKIAPKTAFPFSQGPLIVSSFSIAEEDSYDVYLRMLKSTDGGQLAVSLDGTPFVQLSTIANTNHLAWEKIYSGRLASGTHDVTIRQLSGVNALNIGYVVKQDSEGPDLSGKTIIYRLVGRKDFYGEHFDIVENATASTFYCIRSNKPLFSDINVFEPGYYSVSYEIAGPAIVLVDGERITDGIHLEKGPHSIEVRPVDSAICLDHLTLINEGHRREFDAELLDYTRIDPSTYSVTVNSSTPFFLSLGRLYDPLWIASVDGNDYFPTRSYEAVNLYYINETGLSEIIIVYAPQKTSYAGAIIGIIGLALTTAYAWRFRQ